MIEIGVSSGKTVANLLSTLRSFLVGPDDQCGSIFQEPLYPKTLPMKPYQSVPINDCQEPLMEIPEADFFRLFPHPYGQVGAPYGSASPFYLRTGVLSALHQAQKFLQAHHPAWKLGIFDAYRPVAVQKYMVEFTFAELLKARNLQEVDLTSASRAALWQDVYTFWAVPSDDPQTPPPHSTGAAIDITLIDTSQNPVDMGSPIDEISPRSFPDYFLHQAQDETLTPEHRVYCQKIHHHREILFHAMGQAGFQRHPQEWWHFSYGDQLWAWLSAQATGTAVTARYGRADLISI